MTTPEINDHLKVIAAAIKMLETAREGLLKEVDIEGSASGYDAHYCLNRAIMLADASITTFEHHVLLHIATIEKK